MRAWLLILCLCFPWWALRAEAHKASDSYLHLSLADARIEGQWDLALRDLEYAIGLDENDDGAITWGELRRRRAAVSSYALSRLHIRADGAACAPRATDYLVDYHTDGAYAVLRFVADCPRPPATLELDYRFFFDLDPQHRGLVRLTHQGQTHAAIMSPERTLQQWELRRLSTWRQLASFGREGVRHIWSGYDHMLFLLALLLPAVLKRRAGIWQPVPGFAPAGRDVLKIVTAFTLAHSLTLSLATLGVLHLPSRWVEAAIAASVVVAALNNVYPFFQPARRWLLGLGFGLLHGCGFAGVLLDLGLPRGTLLLSLIGFNLGIEAGQLVLVGAFLPLAFGLRRFWFYRRLVVVLGSLAVAALALVWVVERALDMALLFPAQ